MQEIIIIISVINLILLIVLFIKQNSEKSSDFAQGINEKLIEQDKLLRQEMLTARQEARTGDEQVREAVLNAFARQSDLLEKQFQHVRASIMESIKDNRQQNELNRELIEKKLGQIQKDNNEKLEKMRETVDEKLQSTLNKRISEAFTTVQQQLERVHKDLGTMQNLANGVGDLKRVLSNVKERGTWGEVKLGAILQQILTPEQYEENVQVKSRSQERVDFAIKLPGQENNSILWLPVDAKFPQESYLRLVEASQQADRDAVEKAAAELLKAVKKSAADIRDKYINPPQTTDFAIMFLPTEGLYSEVLRIPGALESIQQNYRVVIAGPTTLAAIMNSLRMGFKTLAIEKKAGEVWKYLSVVKTQFRLFGKVMEKLKDQVGRVSKTIDETSDRTRIMDSRLRSLEEISATEAEEILGLKEEN